MKCLKTMLLLLLVVISSIVFGAYSEAYAENDISIDFSLESEVGEIGKPFYVHYSVSGGSGSYSNIRIDGTLIDGDNSVSGGAIFDTTESSGTASIVPYTGKEMVLYIFVTDSDGRTAKAETNVPLVANTDIPVFFEFTSQEVNAGEELTVDYSIRNCESIRDTTATWIIREKGNYEEENEYSKYQDVFTKVETTSLNSSAGRLSYKPNFGDDIFLVIKGYTNTGEAFYAQSKRIAIKGGDDVPIEIELVNKDEYAVLGKPYHVSYRVSGGSGSYTVEIDGTLIGADHTVLGSAINTSNNAEDELTIVPDNGSYMVLYIFVTDSHGKKGRWESNSNIIIKSNPDYPVHCEIVRACNTIMANYSISNLTSDFAGTVLWKIGETSEWDPEWDKYSGEIKKEEITTGSGSTSITPAFGDSVILIISGKTSNGSPVYFAKKVDIVPTSKHILEKHERIEPTSSAPGTEAYWECTSCGSLFSDEKGENEIEEPIVIPKEEPISGLLHLDDDGAWRYYENDTFVEKTGIVEFEGGLFFVGNGVLCSDANGLASYDDHWYFLANGQIQTQYTGLALYDGEWFYVQNGLFDPNLNGLVDYDGSKFIVAAGRIIRGVSGLWQNTDGVWYYLADSQVVTYYTGLTQYDGAWFYVINGRLATEFTGEVEYDGAVFNVVSGEVV